MVWTLFWDMHSGGNQKEKASKIYIEAPKEEAILMFKNIFRHDPFNVTCSCCGEDYVVDEDETFEQSSGYHRGCAYQNTDVDGNPITNEQWHTIPVEKRGKGYFVERSGDRPYLNYKTVEEYIKDPDVMVIRANEWMTMGEWHKLTGK